MVKLSANLSYLWPELELLDAIRKAADHGFDAVEVHWPYITHALEVAMVMEGLQLPMISLNTVGGDLSQGEFGLAAVPGRTSEARASIDKAVAYAADVSCQYIHVLAGQAEGDEASETYIENLTYAARKADEFSLGVLIEPMNTSDNPGYFLTHLDDAAHFVQQVDEPNLKILFDCYHIQIMEGDLARRFEEHQANIGHVQIAAIPGRGEPDHGEVDYPKLMAALDGLGYTGYVGAEYKPSGPTSENLGWMADIART